MKLKDKLNGVHSSKFIKSISVLASGSAISVILLGIQHILQPYIFTPEELGIKSVILAIPTACTGIVCGRYDLSLVYEEDEERINPLLKLNFLVIIIISSIVTIVCLIYFLWIETSLSRYLYMLLPIWIYMVSFGLTNTLNSYNNRYREYKVIAKMHVYRTAVQSLGTVFLGLIFVFWMKIRALSVPILVIPYCVGMLAGVFSQGKNIWINRASIANVKAESVRAIAKKHSRQLYLSSPAIFANMFSYSLITIFTNALYGETITGYYSLSITLLGLPITLISGNLSKVYMRDAANEYDKTGKYIQAFKKNAVFLVALAIPMFFIMFFLAPPLCAALFGQKWLVAGEYIKALSIMFCFRFISTALSPGLYIAKKQTAELIIQVSLLVVTALVGLAGNYYIIEPITFMWILGIARSIVMLVHVCVVYYYSKGGERRAGIDGKME